MYKAPDYCVRATGLDARAAGLGVVVLDDAVCAVNLQADDGRRALAELAAAGCSMISIEGVLRAMGSGACRRRPVLPAYPCCSRTSTS